MALNDILFCEDFLFEGEQAEEYKRRKRAEKQAQKDSDEKYVRDRWKKKEKDPNSKTISKGYNTSDSEGEYIAPGDRMTKQNPNYGIKHPIKTAKGSREDAKRRDAVRDKHFEKTGTRTYHDKTTYKNKYDHFVAADARNRHARRHPEQYGESADLMESIVYEDFLI